MVSGTPSRWQTWLTSDDFAAAIKHIRIARAGGEKFSNQLLDQLKAVTEARIFNCYGPTEITVASNNKELTNAQVVTVGKPQLNVKEFIVDQDGNELPIGVVGELYIGGRGVARGYNNLDDMTQELFSEIVRADALERVHYGLDFFDGSINRIGAYVIGSRSAQKCMLRALLEPKELLAQYELAGEGYKLLGVMEEQKAMPWQAVYDMFCLKNNVPVGDAFIAEIAKYEAEVTSKR